MAKRRTTETQAPVNAIANTLHDMEDMPAFSRETQFAPGRQWAFDIAWPTLMVALEYEGNTWAQTNGENAKSKFSRHTVGAGYRGDVDKYNTAASLGWLVIRVTADMVRDLAYLDPLLTAIYTRQILLMEG